MKKPKQQSRNKPSLVVFRQFFLQLLILNNKIRKWAMNKEHTGEQIFAWEATGCYTEHECV